VVPAVQLADRRETHPTWRAAPLLFGPLVLLTVLTWIGTLATPALAGVSPLVLLLLTPRTPVLVLAAARSPFWLFLPVATFRLAVADPFNFLIGRRWGPRVMTWSSERSTVARWMWRLTERAMGRAGLLVVALHPAGSVMVLAGASGMDGWAVALADLVGTVVYLVLLRVAAPMTVGMLGHVTRFMGHYSLLLSAATGLAIASWLLLAWRARRAASCPAKATLALEPAPGLEPVAA
jgi:hypothetical protein